MTDKLIVFVTCSSDAEASKIARALVELRLAACVNIHESRVCSVYRWKGSIKTAHEVLLVIKTSRRRFRALAAAVERLHSYDVPEVIALPVASGSAKYLAWIDECLRATKRRRPSSKRKGRRR